MNNKIKKIKKIINILKNDFKKEWESLLITNLICTVLFLLLFWINMECAVIIALVSSNVLLQFQIKKSGQEKNRIKYKRFKEGNSSSIKNFLENFDTYRGNRFINGRRFNMAELCFIGFAVKVEGESERYALTDIFLDLLEEDKKGLI